MSDEEAWFAIGLPIHTAGVQWGRGQDSVQATRVFLLQSWQSMSSWSAELCTRTPLSWNVFRPLSSSEWKMDLYSVQIHRLLPWLWQQRQPFANGCDGRLSARFWS